MPAILDVAIGTVFVFLLFSLVVSALNEAILSKFDQRAKFLHMGLQELFGEAGTPAGRIWRSNWIARLTGGLLSKVQLSGRTQKLCEHGLINALSRTDKPGAESPSYIPAGSFVSALLSIISQSPAAASADAGTAAGLNPTQKSWWERFLTAAGAHLQALGGASQPPAIDNTTRLASVAAALQQSVAALPSKYDELRNALNARLARAGSDVTELTAIAADLRKEVLAPGGLEHTADNIERWINNLEPGKLKESLQSLFLVAGKDVKKFTDAVEGWFNATMDRVSGWYKRFAQKWMIAIGFILAAILNVDTIHIVQQLSTTPNLAKAVASQAEGYVRTHEAPMGEREAREAARAATEKAQLELATATANGDPEAKESAKAKLATAEANEDADAKFHAAVARLSETGIPIGWDVAQRRALGFGGERVKFCEWLSQHSTKLLELIAGWLLTALAASLGAPFWFDTLNRFVNLRNAGRPPGETDPTAKATKPPPATLDKTPQPR